MYTGGSCSYIVTSVTPITQTERFARRSELRVTSCGRQGPREGNSVMSTADADLPPRHSLACDDQEPTQDPRGLIGVMAPGSYLHWRLPPSSIGQMHLRDTLRGPLHSHPMLIRAPLHVMDCVCDRLVGLGLISNARPPNRPDLRSDFSLPLFSR